jgi:hypothetical protein
MHLPCTSPLFTHGAESFLRRHTVSIFRAEALKPRRRRHYVSPKRWYLPTSLHGVTTQKNNIVILAAVRTSDLTISNVVYIVVNPSWQNLSFFPTFCHGKHHHVLDILGTVIKPVNPL